MGRRAGARAMLTLVVALVGAVWLSGSDQPVTAHPFPQWQELAAPPLSPRTHALGVRVGHRVLVLGGRRDGHGVRGGAAYDLLTGRWSRVRTPVPLTDRDAAVGTGGVVVVRRHSHAGGSIWWSYDARRDAWSPLGGAPAGASAPTAYHSEVYVVARRRIVVLSVQLGRWTPLPADRLRPLLHHGRVTPDRHGTVLTGDAGTPPRLVADRWDGVRWRRLATLPPSSQELGPRLPDGAQRAGVTRVTVGGRLLVVAGRRAWLRTP